MLLAGAVFCCWWVGCVVGGLPERGDTDKLVGRCWVRDGLLDSGEVIMAKSEFGGELAEVGYIYDPTLCENQTHHK